MQPILLSALHTDASTDIPAILKTVLAAYGSGVTKLLGTRGIVIRILDRGEAYASASETLRELKVEVDNWPVPPAGLFIVAEQTAYFRQVTPMTVAHELGHAFDLALGNGAYYSAGNGEIRRAFAAANEFVTSYAATRIDEYFAESVHAWLGINDVSSPWPAVSREKLRRVDPAMFSIVEALFSRFPT